MPQSSKGTTVRRCTDQEGKVVSLWVVGEEEATLGRASQRTRHQTISKNQRVLVREPEKQWASRGVSESSSENTEQGGT